MFPQDVITVTHKNPFEITAKLIDIITFLAQYGT
jgi:hypothetical protein